MKIAFFCGSLEPGHDGVGDYTRQLAAALAHQGHRVTIIALCDKALPVQAEQTQETDNIKVPVLRIPYNYSSRLRFRIAEKRLASFDPDWISLQYVPYSFNNKGLPFGLPRLLRQLGKGRNWHIMFHELWIGFTKISPLKHKIVGFLQERIAASLVKYLQPKAITTSNRLYQLLLLRHHVNPTILPLFSNIPVVPAAPLFISSVFEQLEVDENERYQYFITGFFGNLYPEAKLENLLQDQLRMAGIASKKMICLGFGNMNGEGMKEFRRLESVFDGQIKFLHLGSQPVVNVSNLMQLLDTALSCTPAQHIGKSGVFAALKLHGVKVIVPAGDTIPEYDQEIKEYAEDLLNRPAENWSVNHISRHFSQLLTVQA